MMPTDPTKPVDPNAQPVVPTAPVADPVATPAPEMPAATTPEPVVETPMPGATVPPVTEPTQPAQ